MQDFTGYTQMHSIVFNLIHYNNYSKTHYEHLRTNAYHTSTRIRFKQTVGT